MIEHGMAAKAVIEGPPRRACPILLRQTSFKALEEAVHFPDAEGVMPAPIPRASVRSNNAAWR